MSGSKAAKLFFSLLLSFVVQLAFAASNIVGFATVKGPDAPVGPIANAFVMVSDPAFPKQVLYVGQTNAQGFYSINGVAPGTYRVDFSKPGFLKGILSSFALADNKTVQINAQLVPSLTGIEIYKNNVKDQSSYTVNNPNSFPVTYRWSLPQKPSGGTSVAYPGENILETGVWPHTKNITLVVDGAQVQKETTTVVLPPVLLGNLTGLVNSSSGPLGGVQVVLNDAQDNQIATTFTLANGSYVFTNQPAGTYNLSYTLTGYIPAGQTSILPSGGGQVPTVTLSPVPVPPTATVSVTVVTDQGGPAPDSVVSISYSNGTSAHGVADGNGLVSFTGQPVGLSANITADANDGTMRHANIATSGFVAGSNDVTLILPPIPKGSIDGVVRDSDDGHALANVTVAVLDPSHSVVASTTTASDGTFSVGNLTPDTYSMTFSLANYETVSFGGVYVNSGEVTHETVSMTSTLATVTVTVIDLGTGGPVVRADVSIRYANGVTSTGSVDNRGVATFTNQPSAVAAVISVVTADGTGRSGSMDIPTGFSPGPNSVTINIASALGTITGRCFDKVSMAPVFPTVTVTNIQSGERRSTPCDPGGNYTISGLLAGTYSIDAVQPGYETYSSPITISAGQTFAFNIAMQPATGTQEATVVVTVTDDITRLPAPNVSVRIDYSDRSSAGPLITDSRGQVQFNNQPTGITGNVSASAQDGRSTARFFPAFTFGTNNVSLALPAPQTGPGSISGRVVDSRSGDSISGANVVITDTRGAPAGSGQTDGLGGFRIPVSGGTYNVTISVVGYESASIRDIFVTDGANTSVGTVMLTGSGPIVAALNVTVRDADGSNAPNVSVTITFNPPVAGIPTLLTDSRGDVSFSNLPVGRTATVTATAADGRSANNNYPSGFSAGTNSLMLTLPPQAARSIDGHVYDAVTRSPLRASISIYDATGRFLATVTTNADGSYSLTQLSDPYYTLTFFQIGYNSVTVQVLSGSTYDAYLQPIQNTATVNVTVVDDRGVAISGARVTLDYPPGYSAIGGTAGPSGTLQFTSQPTGVLATISASDPTITLTGSATATFVSGDNNVTVTVRGSVGVLTGQVVNDATNQPITQAFLSLRDWNGNSVTTIATGSDGRYQIGNLTAGTYTMQVTGTGYVPLTLTVPVVAGQVNVQNAALTPVDTNLARVTVIVSDAQRRGISNAIVQISYADGSVVTGTTNQSGVVDFWNQPVGVPAVISARQIATAEGPRYQVVDGFRAGGNDYELSYPSIAGTVTDQSGAALPGVEVRVVDDATGNTVRTSTTGNDGTYAMSGIAAGRYSIFFSRDGYGTLQVPGVQITAAGGVIQNATLGPPPPPPSANVFVYVFDNNALAFVEGASVTIQLVDSRTWGPFVTDASGLAYFPGLPSGILANIIVEGSYGRAEYGVNAFTGGDNTLTMFYPGGGNPHPVPTTTATIRILDPQNQPVNNATVSITYANGMTLTGVTSESGTLTLHNQPAGQAATITVTSDYGSGSSTQTFTEGIYSGVVHITPTHTRLTVNVVAGDGSGPVANANVFIGSESAVTDANGVAIFNRVPVGSTRIDANTFDNSKSGGESFVLIGTRDTVTVMIF